jgi:Protein of unknown function (DUF3176)
MAENEDGISENQSGDISDSSYADRDPFHDADDVSTFQPLVESGGPEYAPIPGSAHDLAGPGSWYLEIGAVILSSGALTLAMIALWYKDGKPITQYTFYLSLNAVISILSTIAKASLAFALTACMGQAKWNWFRSHRSALIGFQRFDEGSRGPWGSIKFLWWLRLR